MPTEAAGTDLTVRRALPADLRAVAELYTATRVAAVPLMPPAQHTADEDVAHVAGWDLDRDDVWLAEDPAGDALLGFAHLTDTWLEGLYVAPAAQGRGVGRTLLALARAERPAGFCLWVFLSNTPARSLYRSAGLVELETTDGADNEEHAPDVRMAWPGTDPLAFYRGLIDEVDDALGGLLARRAALTGAVQAVRPGGRDPAREAEIVARLAHRAPALGPERVAVVLDAIIGQSLDAAGSETVGG